MKITLEMNDISKAIGQYIAGTGVFGPGWHNLKIIMYCDATADVERFYATVEKTETAKERPES